MTPNIKILIAEDEAITAMCLRLELTRLGYAVCQTVSTGESALLSADKDRPDIVLMDIRLAGKMSGIEAASQINSRHRIPILFMSGYNDKDLTEQSFPFKPAGYFTKPIDTAQIISAIEAIWKDKMGTPAVRDQ
jgi:DNA-binding NarL/FixJ family response regulator